MATPYPGSTTPLAQSAQDATAAPVIRTIQLSDLHRALQLGWEDFKAVPSHAIILCVIYPVLGLLFARAAVGFLSSRLALIAMVLAKATVRLRPARRIAR